MSLFWCSNSTKVIWSFFPAKVAINPLCHVLAFGFASHWPVNLVYSFRLSTNCAPCWRRENLNEVTIHGSFGGYVAQPVCSLLACQADQWRPVHPETNQDTQRLQAANYVHSSWKNFVWITSRQCLLLPFAGTSPLPSTDYGSVIISGWQSSRKSKSKCFSSSPPSNI
jgi:hypothetical protein